MHLRQRWDIRKNRKRKTKSESTQQIIWVDLLWDDVDIESILEPTQDESLKLLGSGLLFPPKKN